MSKCRRPVSSIVFCPSALEMPGRLAGDIVTRAPPAGGRRWRAPCLLVHLVLQLLQLPLELLYLLLELVGGLCRGGMDGEEHRAPQCPAQEMLYPLFHVLPLPSGVRGRRGPDRRPLAARNLSSHSYTPATSLLPFEDCRKEIGAMQSPETLKTAFSNRR